MTDQLPSRYEIRNLGPEHSDWANAILCHTNLFYGPLWNANYTGQERTKRCLDLYKVADYLVDHQINSGYSFGVFDKEYVFKRPESAATGGKCYWDVDDAAATGDELLAQMDFPLVSIALSYDSINALDHARMGELVNILPEYAEGFKYLALGDRRDPASWQATGPLQVLFRNATSTRRDYEARGLMKYQAHWLMRWAADKGFRGIQIEAFNDAVNHVWTNPPPPFKGEAVSTVLTGEIVEVQEDGSERRPFGKGTQRLTKCYVTLK
ncbi:hypothetical protein GTA08_BOTSDO03571 [Neofusicoccum parvum]|uniref:Uncharacterized protein n=2 Tax=Neofusicoccum parvum TaxID=310453 RepID=R1GMU6_BOTPV|nr:hypothetical protein UCRNP2_3588 [Neofusicoccum parvum UCRNP2]GME24044.1 hypothetical protein GTA08_BOTSDO03571 [Neofusicoccum parvum]GME55642.1 hypothetical protein GTA08_BOTSDO03571 [Neofusicoccum parvum]